MKHEPDLETFWLFGVGDEEPELQRDFTQEFEYPLPAEKRILKLVSKCEAQYKNDPSKKRQMQPLKLRVRRRLFSMMHFKKDLTSMHKHTVLLTYYQARSDHVDKCLLKDAMLPEDVAYFAALILKVNLQSLLLTSRKSKLTLETLQKNLKQAVPATFIGVGEGKQTEAQWAAAIQDHFSKKHFTDQSVEEAMEAFITGIAMYEIVFSSHYIVKTGDADSEGRDPFGRDSRRATEAKVGVQIAELQAAGRVTGNASSGGASPRSDRRRSSYMTPSLRRNYEEPLESIIPEERESGEEDQTQDLDNASPGAQLMQDTRVE